MTVGYREVIQKREHQEALGKRTRCEAVASHWFPTVLGPEKRYYIVEHHHLGLVLLEEGVKERRVRSASASRRR